MAEGDLAKDLASLRIDRGGERADAPTTSAGSAAGSGGQRTSSGRHGGGVVRFVVVVGLLAGLGFGIKVAAPRISERVFKPEVQVTEITLVSPAQASVELSSTGYVLPQTVAKVGAKVVGKITKVHVKEGAQVKAGAILFELDATDQKSALATAQAKVASAAARAAAAKARAAAARANVAELEVQLERQKKLAAAGAVTTNTVEDLELKLKGLKAQVLVADADSAAAYADATAAQAEVGVYSGNLSAMTIAAPIDGTAIGKPVSVGDVVSPGTPLVELADFTTLLVETDVPEARLGLVKAGAPCEIVLDAYPDKRLAGEVAEIVPKLNRAKAAGTVKVKITSKVDVLPEMAARVSFLKKALEAAEMKEPPKKVVPAAALVDRAGQKHVFVIDGGKLRLVPVTVGGPFGGGLELKEGPTAGTRVVNNPASALSDGQAVKEGSP